MEFNFIEKKKGVVEIEFKDKEIPVALTGVLLDKGVEAYWYEPHPLIPGFRLHVEADDALEELKKALSGLGSEWSQFRKAVEAKLK